MSEASTDSTATRYRFVLCAATLTMLVGSWPLWADDGPFPRVPFFLGWPKAGILAPLLRAGMIAGLLLAAIGVVPRRSLAVALVLMTSLILGDQHRFQPWAYQFLLIGLALAVAPAAEALVFARWCLIALYAHSALSKIDFSFCDELGQTFLQTSLRPFGLRPELWSPTARIVAALTMPGAELLVAACLACRKTRRAGLVGAIAVHLGLLTVLGPLGLNHSANVLIWNGSMIAQDLLIFGPGCFLIGPAERRFSFLPIRVVLYASMLLPFGERFGLFDTWPSHAVYASHAERTEVAVAADDANRLPDSLGRHLGRDEMGDFRALDLAGWSLAERGTPLYPQNRAWHGVAVALAERDEILVRVIHRGRASALSGRRDSIILTGREMLRDGWKGSWLNAMPSPASVSEPHRMPRPELPRD
ncbi:hypothetical protein EP7_003654 [Isosphaeraceae bacterium EP7]